MAAAKCRNRRRELTDTLQAVSAAREVAGKREYPGRG